MSTRLIRVDERNRPRGTISWEEAHATPGILHRAFSLYIFRNGGSEMLIQRRSAKKPLWAGTWANSCCSHPRDGEEMTDATHRRLQEELGFDCELTEAGAFTYQADDPHGNGSEHEHVTIFRGDADGATVSANPDEVGEWKWIPVDALRDDMTAHPESYAPWFHIGLKKL